MHHEHAPNIAAAPGPVDAGHRAQCRPCQPQRHRPGAGAVVFTAVLVAVTFLLPGTGAAARVESKRCSIVAPAAEHRDLTGSAGGVERLYRALFLRSPEPAGLDYWVTVLDTGRADPVAVADLFATSREFRSRYGPLSDDQFVDLLYCNVLGRSTHDPGRRYWADQLRAGLTRAEAVFYFSQSPEFVQRSALAASGPAADEAPDDGHTANEPLLVWREEFERLDTNRWRPEHSTYGDGNNELQCYRPENVSVVDGALVLRARTENYTCPNGSTRSVTSGMVRGSLRFGHGQRIEYRVKVNPADPDDQRGLWPALWASGWNGGGWPAGGEFDWLEYVGTTPTRSNHAIHWQDPQGRHRHNSKPVELGERFSDRWHVIGFDWSGELIWYLDGREVHRVAPEALDVANDPFGPAARPVTEVKLNLALGGNWPGPLGPTTVDAAGTTSLLIDYIRIYDLP